MAKQEEVYQITLSLTPTQMQLARNALSDLGTKDSDCRKIQLAFANAMLDALVGK